MIIINCFIAKHNNLPRRRVMVLSYNLDDLIASLKLNSTLWAKQWVTTISGFSLFIKAATPFLIPEKNMSLKQTIFVTLHWHCTLN